MWKWVEIWSLVLRRHFVELGKMWKDIYHILHEEKTRELQATNERKGTKKTLTKQKGNGQEIITIARKKRFRQTKRDFNTKEQLSNVWPQMSLLKYCHILVHKMS